MLDTLKLCLDGYGITDDIDLEVMPSVYNSKTGEFRGHYPLFQRGDEWIRGSKAFYNFEEMRVTLKPFNASEPQSIGCWAEFSVPKVANGSNYEPANFGTTKTALAMVESQLKSIGIKTNIQRATISRLDACKSVLTSEPYQAYAPVLARLQGQRMAVRGYGTTFLWHNTVQEICVYDKREEMKHRKKNISRVPKNVVRFEHRMKTGRKVRDVLGVRTVAELLEGFEQVPVAYRSAMEKQLFRYSPAELEIRTVQDFETDLLILKSAGIRNYVTELVLVHGLKNLTADKEAFLTAVENVSDSRMTLHRTKKMLREADMNALSLQRESTSKHTLGELYRELEREVVSV